MNTEASCGCDIGRETGWLSFCGQGCFDGWVMSSPVITFGLPFPFSPSKIKNPLLFTLSPPPLGLVILVILVFISNLGRSGNLLYSHCPLTFICPRRVPNTSLSPCVISVSALGCFISLTPGWNCPASFFFPSNALSSWQFLLLLSYCPSAGACGVQEWNLNAANCCWKGKYGENGTHLLWEMHSKTWSGNSNELHQRKYWLVTEEKIFQKG